MWDGIQPDRLYVLLAQQSPFDPTQAPQRKHTAWEYCHVPHGSKRDVSDLIDDQIKRFAPEFKDRILARSVRTAADMVTYNPNYVGGDISGGV